MTFFRQHFDIFRRSKKCRNMSKMSKYVEKCRKMSRNIEKCRKKYRIMSTPGFFLGGAIVGFILGWYHDIKYRNFEILYFTHNFGHFILPNISTLFSLQTTTSVKWRMEVAAKFATTSLALTDVDVNTGSISMTTRRLAQVGNGNHVVLFTIPLHTLFSLALSPGVDGDFNWREPPS